jgi:phage terminase small subunit
MTTKKNPTTKKRTVRQSQPEAIGAEGLTAKQRVFVEEYFICNLNATEAARRAGYSEKSIRSIASENLTKHNISQAIKTRLAEHHLSADEVIARLSALASADMADFLSISGRGIKLDLKRARELGKLHLVRKYNKTDKGVSIELVDAKDALVQLGRYYGLFTDKIQGEIETLSSDEIEQRREKRWEKAAPTLAAALAKRTQGEAGNVS